MANKKTVKNWPKIRVESGPPPPPRRCISGVCAALWAALTEMREGQSFIWPEHTIVYYMARRVGVKITTRKLNGEGYRVWLLRGCKRDGKTHRKPVT